MEVSIAKVFPLDSISDGRQAQLEEMNFAGVASILADLREILGVCGHNG
ncbi:MAG: hypothetical protein RML93_03655 [Anaerolineales bacterium]|nr:hypothetical protein [Anaerolineales bacterium]MCS7248428.1 hypothetical protein [Anaerolineales bacterium]MDW8162241.1 hypothetical protein [Anaerolineales bacterium]MDW8446371.1 hypothetical protein [Anaerolineales bacterium]